MLFKLSIKFLFIAAEIVLGIYTFAISESLLVKFIFFALTAVIIAFLVSKAIHKLLPIDKNYTAREQKKGDLEKSH